MQQISLRVKDETLEEINQLASLLTEHNEIGKRVSGNGLIRYAMYKLLENKKEIYHDIELVKNFPLVLRSMDYHYEARNFDVREYDDMELFFATRRKEQEESEKAIKALDEEI